MHYRFKRNIHKFCFSNRFILLNKDASNVSLSIYLIYIYKLNYNIIQIFFFSFHKTIKQSLVFKFKKQLFSALLIIRNEGSCDIATENSALFQTCLNKFFLTPAH